MKQNLMIILLLIFGLFAAPLANQSNIYGKKINVKGDYIHPKTSMTFPVQFDQYIRNEVISFDKKQSNVGVSYYDLNKQTKITVYVYPAGNGDDGRLRNEFYKSKLSIDVVAGTVSNAKTSLVRHIGKKYICNGILGVVEMNGKPNKVIEVYECGRWFFKTRITTNELDSTSLQTLLLQINKQFDPSKLTETEPLDSTVNVSVSKSALQDSLLLGAVISSAINKIEWADSLVVKNERASGFPDLYLDQHVEALKGFLSFSKREDSHFTQVNDYTKKCLRDLQLIMDNGFLKEFVLDQFDLLLIYPQNEKVRLDEFRNWSIDKNITFNLKQRFFLLSYGKNK
ncbi:MAG: hypothetical protein PHT07_22985 [Paludibacter sp.]|nr:hypothetical protein [Paludibacter sp.]